MEQSKKTLLLWGILILAAIGAIVKFALPVKNNGASNVDKKDSATPQSVVNTPRESSSQAATAVKQVSVKTSYANPGGSDDVTFTLGLDASGIIVDAKTDILATHGISRMRQEAFAAGLPAVVVGKKLSDLSMIDKVGGSSLTTQAFNDSLTQLKAQL